MDEYKMGLYDALFELGKLHEEHRMMGDDEDTLRGIVEAKNKTTELIENA